MPKLDQSYSKNIKLHNRLTTLSKDRENIPCIKREVYRAMLFSFSCCSTLMIAEKDCNKPHSGS